jgi:HK97 family phage prohead protease
MTKDIKSLSAEIADINEGKGIVTIQVTRFGEYDYDNDRMMQGAFTKTWNESQQVHLVEHQVGVSTWVGLPVAKDPNSGIIESKINLNKQVGKDLLADYMFGRDNGRSLQHSHGFSKIRGKYQKNEKGGYDIYEVKQFEYSTVLFGAVENTPLLAIKSKADLEDLLLTLKAKISVGQYSDEYGRLLESKIDELKTMLSEPQEIHSPEPLITPEVVSFVKGFNF